MERDDSLVHPYNDPNSCDSASIEDLYQCSSVSQDVENIMGIMSE
jgi:hypothetical protein